jgi:hypothetical protein
MYEDLKREGKLKFSYAFADSPGGTTADPLHITVNTDCKTYNQAID